MIRELGPAGNSSSMKRERSSNNMTSNSILRKGNPEAKERIQRINDVHRSRSYDGNMAAAVGTASQPKMRAVPRPRRTDSSPFEAEGSADQLLLKAASSS
ncbi:hypothetical protein FGB62_139g243 [Gracilaria domingensis]|nr:hypothetical protein FGB62_139g243 [Gracilaria domingensis]